MPKSEVGAGSSVYPVDAVPECGYHTLTSRPICPPIASWAKFLERWNWAVNHQELLSLLHAGYSIPYGRTQWDEKEYESVDRHIFYLIIAYGWEDPGLLRRSDDGDGSYALGYDDQGRVMRKTSAQLRQELAVKAFTMLCLNLFRNTSLYAERSRVEFHSDWVGMILTDKFLPVLMNFFRVTTDAQGRKEVCNLPRAGTTSHPEVHAVDFLLTFTRFLWSWKEEHVDSWRSDEWKDEVTARNREIRARVNTAMPWMVEVLNQLDRLDILKEWTYSLNRPCLAKLREIALRAELQDHRHLVVNKDRRVADLEEACFAGSKAAWFLQRHALLTRVNQRLAWEQQARRDLEEAQRRVEKLSGKGK